MYKILFTIIVFIVIQKDGHTQELDEFFNSTDLKVTWLGVDFSHSRFIGNIGVPAGDVKERYADAINEVIILENIKYNLEKTLNKKHVSRYLFTVAKQNSKIDTIKMVSILPEEKYSISNTTLDSIINGYDFADKNGMGVVLIMKEINKTNRKAEMYFVVINMDEHKILFSELMYGSPMGFGFRNYWANSINEVLNGIEFKFHHWKKIYKQK